MTTIRARLLQILRDPFPQAELTPKERRVVQLIARGWTYHRIAVKLGVGIPTVKTLAQRAADKVGVSPREMPEAVIRKMLAAAGD